MSTRWLGQGLRQVAARASARDQRLLPLSAVLRRETARISIRHLPPVRYPAAWIAEGRVWSEAYALRAFLAFNEALEIVLFNAFLERFHRRLFEEALPLCLRNEGGSIWLRRAR